MAGILSTLIRGYEEQLQRYRNRLFLRAAMAACATVAMVSGGVSLRQRMRVDQIMETLDALKLFDPHEGVDLFNEYVEGIQKDPAWGRIRAMEAVDSEVAEEPEKARLLMRICAAVSKRNGEIHEPERREIQRLCARYGLEPNECGLGSADIKGG